MDDALELPSSKTIVKSTDDLEEEAQSEEDDGGPDWTKLPSSSKAPRPVIPKRGEKEYEPKGTEGAGTGLQQHKLDRIRTAMFSALDVDRVISTKAVSYGIWIPQTSRVHVTQVHGPLFYSVGHSVPLKLPEELVDNSLREKLHSRQILLPEEALYMIERGSMLCWKGDESLDIRAIYDISEGSIKGVPMSVQQAYSEMIGREHLTLEKYQVYAHLKRMGYAVLRATPPDAFYPIASKRPLQANSHGSKSISSWIFKSFLSSIQNLFSYPRDWWKPLDHRNYFHGYLNYSSLFASLRFFPLSPRFNSFHNLRTQEESSPYRVFYHLYKPATVLRKRLLPPPDFHIVVINGRTMPMPTLSELSALFEDVPELPPPVPRQRQATSGDILKSSLPPPITSLSQGSSSNGTLLCRLLRWLGLYWRPISDQKRSSPRKPNPFQMLKLGKKMIVIAIVDVGMISFFRFAQGAFEEWPMI